MLIMTVVVVAAVESVVVVVAVESVVVVAVESVVVVVAVEGVDNDCDVVVLCFFDKEMVLDSSI